MVLLTTNTGGSLTTPEFKARRVRRTSSNTSRKRLTSLLKKRGR